MKHLLKLCLEIVMCLCLIHSLSRSPSLFLSLFITLMVLERQLGTSLSACINVEFMLFQKDGHEKQQAILRSNIPESLCLPVCECIVLVCAGCDV